MLFLRRRISPRRWALAFSALALLAQGLVASSWPASVRAEGLLVTRDDAARNGLERAWFAQVAVDPSRSRVTTWLLDFGQIYAVTDSGIMTALNAETGATLWTKQIGKPGQPAFGPGANAQYVAVVSVDKLLLFHRETGRLIWSRELGSAPAAGPALSREYAYVGLLNGRIEGYKLDDPKLQPWYYQSEGRIYHRPTTTGRVVSWPTSTGRLYVSDADDPEVKFRLVSDKDIVTSPAESEPWLYIASLDGYLYCINETNGRGAWRFSTGYPISSSPAIVGERAFVASLEPSLFAIDAKNGGELWSAPGASHFGAMGKDRVYASDRYGNLLVLDAKTGNPLGRLGTAEGMRTLVNDQSDRIFLVSDRGLVQCLRESGAVEPTMYRQPFETQMATEAAAAAKKKTAGGEPESPAAEEAPAAAPAEEAPAADKPAESDDSPFAPATDAKGGDAGAGENPFDQ